MLKYAMLIAILCCAGCQTTQTATGSATVQDSPRRSEKLTLRVEKYVTSYDVEVQRSILTSPKGSDEQRWTVVSAPRVSGYPNRWKTTESILNPVEPVATASYLLNGEMVKISRDPGVHLTAKILPERQNTARVIGVFSSTKMTAKGEEVFSVPFDVSCLLGELNVIYLEEFNEPAASVESTE